MANKEVKVACKVRKGFLENELLVEVKGKDGKTHETWAEKEQVEAGSNTMVVREIQDSDENILIELPNETTAGGRRLWVPKSILV